MEYIEKNLLICREKEINLVIDELKQHQINSILEIGSASGFQTGFLKKISKNIISFDIYKHEENKEKNFVVASIEKLPFKCTFDLIFSSNVVEHFPNYDLAFSEIKRVSNGNTIVAHVVPTATWMILYYISYYPFLLRILLYKLFPKMKKEDKRSKAKPADPKRPLLTKLLPPIHGEAKTRIQEFNQFRVRSWRKFFKSYGFEIIKEKKLLLYSTPEFQIIPPNQFLVKLLGLTSSIMFVMKKK